MAFLPKVTQEQFEAMTQEQRWVAVAEDVLAQLDAKRIVPECGAFFEAETEFTVQRETLVGDCVPPCTVCGVGAVFLATVRLGNRYERETDYLGYEDFAWLLEDALGRDAVLEVEFAFENGTGMVEAGWVGYEYTIEEEVGNNLSQAFGGAEPGETRLRAIMQAIIANGGTLLPRTADVS